MDLAIADLDRDLALCQTRAAAQVLQQVAERGERIWSGGVRGAGHTAT
jgi:hypothetical protein